MSNEKYIVFGIDAHQVRVDIHGIVDSSQVENLISKVARDLVYEEFDTEDELLYHLQNDEGLSFHAEPVPVEFQNEVFLVVFIEGINAHLLGLFPSQDQAKYAGKVHFLDRLDVMKNGHTMYMSLIIAKAR